MSAPTPEEKALDEAKAKAVDGMFELFDGAVSREDLARLMDEGIAKAALAVQNRGQS